MVNYTYENEKYDGNGEDAIAHKEANYKKKEEEENG